MEEKETGSHFCRAAHDKMSRNKYTGSFLEELIVKSAHRSFPIHGKVSKKLFKMKAYKKGTTSSRSPRGGARRVTELISDCKTRFVSSSEKSCSVHTIYSRAEVCTLCDFPLFLSIRTSRSRRHRALDTVQGGGQQCGGGKQTRQPRVSARRCRGRRRQLRSVCPGGEFAAARGMLLDARCVSGQQEEGRGSESSGSRRQRPATRV